MSQGFASTTSMASLGFRWRRWLWMTPTLIFTTWAAGAIALAEWKKGAEVPSLLCGLAAFGAGFLAFGLLRLGWAVIVQSSVFRADSMGLKHCLLPTIPWCAMRGVDIRKYIPRSNVSGSDYRFSLVIACDREFLISWSPRWVWDLLNWVGPRYDLNASLVDIKLEFSAVDPFELLAHLIAVAELNNARLVRNWTQGFPIELARQREQALEALKSRDKAMHAAFDKLNLSTDREAQPATSIEKK